MSVSERTSRATIGCCQLPWLPNVGTGNRAGPQRPFLFRFPIETYFIVTVTFFHWKLLYGTFCIELWTRQSRTHLEYFLFCLVSCSQIAYNYAANEKKKMKKKIPHAEPAKMTFKLVYVSCAVSEPVWPSGKALGW